MFTKWLVSTQSTWGELDDAISLLKSGAVSANNVQEGGKMNITC